LRDGEPERHAVAGLRCRRDHAAAALGLDGDSGGDEQRQGEQRQDNRGQGERDDDGALTGPAAPRRPRVEPGRRGAGDRARRTRAGEANRAPDIREAYAALSLEGRLGLAEHEAQHRGELRLVEQLAQHDAQGVNIGRLVERVPGRLLGRGVAGRAHPAQLGRVRARRPCQAQVDQGDGAVGPHDHVAGMEIAIDQALGVDRREGVDQPLGDR
jgi:hypothetical protein